MKKQMGRLALRVEGDWWVAYYAMPDTMADAIDLGRIRMAAVQDQTHKQAFMALMQHFVGDIILENLGVAPDWNDPVGAPEHERAGRA